ncbi:aldo-keto reductase [Phanerochaete sordida]|uniref:Aldo-keto reductase n=1 Tax=Phanerochaete sordida TaxID=48140 RepID=A0A9P3FWC4_9APHY|nr:aldo-keto reductase [Phanerochaete sordida]
MSLPTRKIGTDSVSCIGFGMMGLSAYYGPVKPDEERFKVLDAAYESGCTFWDTSDAYGDSEELIGKWFKRTGKRNEIFLASKFAFRSGADAEKPFAIDGSPEWARQAIDLSLKRLGVDQIDLWYLHRPDANVPIELTVGAMSEAVKAGKVKYLGISECSAATLRRAHAVHPMAAAQFEYAPFTLGVEDPRIGIRDACKELGITLIAYSPLGRGLLTGKLDPETLSDNDMRKMLNYPRFRRENFALVLQLVDTIGAIGARHGATAAQVALAWLLAQGPDVIPIPGTTNVGRVHENAKAANITLTPEEVKEIRDAVERAGLHTVLRVPEAFESYNYVDTPPLQ